MKIVKRSTLDMISELPSNILENILIFLPLRDAFRTSILSRKWRRRCSKLPQLVFDYKFLSSKLASHGEIMLKIYEILLFHQGPIEKFTLAYPGLESCLEIDKVIIFLSRNGIKEFTLCMWDQEGHELPSFIYSYLEHLKHLNLQSCVFKPPPTFKGFSKLISLELREIFLAPTVFISNCPLLERLTLELKFSNTIDNFGIDAPNLKYLCFEGNITYISFFNTPILTELSLTANDEDDKGESNFDLFKVFGGLPLIENLYMYYKFLKLLAVGNAPKRLPTILNKLKYLELFASFTNMDEFSSALCLIRSSPNLQKLILEVDNYRATNVEAVLEYLTMQDYSDVSLNKLCKVEMQLFTGSRPELEFIKFILARSPELETLHIVPASKEIVKNGYKMFIKLTRFCRASHKAEIIFLGVDEDQDN